MFLRIVCIDDHAPSMDDRPTTLNTRYSARNLPRQSMPCPERDGDVRLLEIDTAEIVMNLTPVASVLCH